MCSDNLVMLFLLIDNVIFVNSNDYYLIIKHEFHLMIVCFDKT